jgi:nucleoside-diphosphate kinase
LNEKTTLCIVLPHMVLHGIIAFLILKGKAGQLLTDILDGGFVITDLQTYRLEKLDAEEFLEVYNGLLTEYSVTIFLFICSKWLRNLLQEH